MFIHFGSENGQTHYFVDKMTLIRQLAVTARSAPVNKQLSTVIDGTSIRFAFVCLCLRVAVIDINSSASRNLIFADNCIKCC